MSALRHLGFLKLNILMAGALERHVLYHHIRNFFEIGHTVPEISHFCVFLAKCRKIHYAIQ